MELTRTQRFIKNYARLMKAPQEFFNVDSVLQTMDDYNKADLRILVVFPSPASTKAVSMTAGVLNDFVIESCPGVFIDFCYAPDQADLKYYDKEQVPYVIGNITHLDASHYDIVGFSISILFESITSSWLIGSFSRCDKPIPLTWTERKDMKLSSVPLMYAGGITCSVADIMFGKLDDGRQAFIDFLHLGEFHCSKLLFDHFIKCRKEGETIQGMLNRFWDEVEYHDWLYQPQAYEVTFNDKNQIISNIKINPHAPDMCRPYYPDEMPKEVGSARGIIMGNGVNAGLGQILAANGCTRSGFCNFSVSGDTLLGTDTGLVSIRDLVGEENLTLQSAGLVTSKAIHYQRQEPLYRVVLASGSFLDCSLNHKWIRAVDIKSKSEKRYTTKDIARMIRKGETFEVLRKLGNHFGLEWYQEPIILEIKENSVLVDNSFYRYNTTLNSDENMIRVNQLISYMNFYGYDTKRTTNSHGEAVIDWWPIANSVVRDEVVAVVPVGVADSTFDVENTTDHTVCYNMIITSNCHEGAYTGGHVENTPERLMELARTCRKYTAATTLKPYSFNMNYLSDYKGCIYNWLGIFPRVTFNNMRLEELGLDVDALKMMKLAGYQRMTAPLEGISARIRNNLLNKNLSEEALDAYLNYGMMMGAIDCKVGIVLTGFEEEEDWQYMWDFNMKWRKRCKEMGGNIPFRYKVTMLVHYPHCPVEYLERKAPKASFYGQYLMPSEWNDKFYENNIRIKLNGFKHSTFLEQAIVDLGRELTQWVYQYVIKPNRPFYNLRVVVNNEDMWEAFKAHINPDYFFNERHFDDYISICHRIHIAMHTNVVLQASRILKDKANAQPTVRCLKTYDGCKVECKAFTFRKNPVVVYSDIKLDDNGKITGTVWEEVVGCRRCKTAADRAKILARNLPKSKTANDIIMYKAPAVRQRLRFRIRRNKDYEVLNPRNTAFISFSNFLRRSDELCKIFWELDSYHNLFWQSEEDKTYVVSGSQIFDVTFTDTKAISLIKELIPIVNSEVKSFEVLGVTEIPLDDKIKVTNLNIFRFESTLSAELWQFAVMNYHGEVKVESSLGGFETIQDSRLQPPTFKLMDKVVGYFAIPAKYSPWHYLQGLFACRKTPLSKLLSTTSITSITTVRLTNMTCMCGKEETVRDIFTGKNQPVGLKCMLGLLTKKL